MPITAKCIIPVIGMLLKHIFRGSQINQKTPPFLYYILLNGFAKNKRWRLNKFQKQAQQDILKARPIE
jgi:hypothetical protein